MMASEEDHRHPPAPTAAYNDVDDFDDDDEDTDPEPLNGALPDEDDADAVAADSDSSDDDATVVTVAIPSSIAAPSSTAGVTIALPDPKRLRIDASSVAPSVEKKPIDDSRRLFQRLWTDEDEIELLQGFLEYMTSRGTGSSGHHLDTAAFYDQIKSKLQLDFNKNQLVEKLRRLKKKYRTVVSKMSSGKEFVFKSPHDQATFEISRKIWSNVAPSHRGAVEFDDDDQNLSQNPNPSPNPNPNSVMMAATPPPPPHSAGYIVGHINLNNAATPVDLKPTNFDLMMGSNMSSSPAAAAAAAAAAAKFSSRKRSRVGNLEDKFVRVDLGASHGGNANVNANSSNVSHNNTMGNNVHVGSTMQGLIEETVRNCLSPMFKDLINNAMNGAGFGGVGGGAIRGVGGLAMNAIPLNFSGVNLGSSGELMDERWRKQQIMELEVYSRRLELVQDQIKLTLEELRSMGG